MTLSAQETFNLFSAYLGESIKKQLLDYDAKQSARKMLELYPTLEIVTNESGIFAISYVPSYQNGCIEFKKVTRRIQKKTFSPEGYLTKEDAINAISPVIDKAKDQFAKIVKEFNNLQAKYNCTISCWSEDTTTDYVSFEMDGFYFHFNIV